MTDRFSWSGDGDLEVLDEDTGEFEPLRAGQPAVGYVAVSPTDDRCARCRSFRPPGACRRVEGTIDPAGWCALYASATAS